MRERQTLWTILNFRVTFGVEFRVTHRFHTRPGWGKRCKCDVI